jgi:hypothetical protein
LEAALVVGDAASRVKGEDASSYYTTVASSDMGLDAKKMILGEFFSEMQNEFEQGGVDYLSLLTRADGGELGLSVNAVGNYGAWDEDRVNEVLEAIGRAATTSENKEETQANIHKYAVSAAMMGNTYE